MARYLLFAGLTCFGMALVPVAPAAELYKCKGDNGETVFSDQPCPGGETLPMRETSTYPALPPPAVLSPTSESTKKKAAVVNYKAAVSTPGPDEVIRNTEGQVSVQGSLQPALAEGHQVRLLLDGKQVRELGSVLSWSLDDIDRGEHSLMIEVVGTGGQVLASSPSSKFMLFRTSAGQSPDGAAGPTAANRVNWPGAGLAPQPGDVTPTAPTKPNHSGPRK